MPSTYSPDSRPLQVETLHSSNLDPSAPSHVPLEPGLVDQIASGWAEGRVSLALSSSSVLPALSHWREALLLLALCQWLGIVSCYYVALAAVQLSSQSPLPAFLACWMACKEKLAVKWLQQSL